MAAATAAEPCTTACSPARMILPGARARTSIDPRSRLLVAVVAEAISDSVSSPAVPSPLREIGSPTYSGEKIAYLGLQALRFVVLPFQTSSS